MIDYKSVQDFIVKAALYDGISTIIRPSERIGGGDILEIIFSKGDRFSTTQFYLTDKYSDPEEVTLYGCKRALYDLLRAPYEEITYEKEND